MHSKEKLLNGLIRDEKDVLSSIGDFEIGAVQEEVIAGIASECWRIVLICNLFADCEKALIYAELGTNWAVTSLFGDWRPYGTSWNPETERREPWGTEEKARQDFSWIMSFYEGLGCACAVDEHESVRQIARYMDGSRLRHVSSTYAEYRDESVDLYENYADLILGRPLRRGGKHAKLEKPLSKRAQLLGKCVAAIADQNVDASVAALSAYAAHHDRYEIEKNCEHIDYISPDATLFDYLIRRMEGNASNRAVPKCVLRLAADTGGNGSRVD